MLIHTLLSSSNGNSCKIESVKGTTILLDVGISYKSLCKTAGIENFSPNALFLTHDHGDHISGAGILGRKTNCKIYITKEAFEHKEETIFGNIIKKRFTFVKGGGTYRVNDLTIKAFSTRHDSRESVGYTVTEKSTKRKFGFLTDTGYITRTIKQAMVGCDAYFIETDYDEVMMEETDQYDDFLKERIKSPFGHLSTQNAINFIREEINLDEVKWIQLGHLSKITNSPELVMSHVKSAFPEYIDKFFLSPTEKGVSLE